jgi:hypothetical protein
VTDKPGDAEYDEFINELLRNAPESWDDDASAEHVAVEYVRALEERVTQLGGTLEKWWQFDQFRYSRKHPLWRWLTSTRQLQREAYGDDVWPKEGDVLADSAMANMFSLMKEMSEAGDEIGWKPWAQPRGWVNRDAYIGELVDVGHFLANLLIGVGCTDDEWEERYQAKQRVNLKRQRDGYDGVTTKCHACKRALDDDGVIARDNPRRAGQLQYTCSGCGAVQDAERIAVTPGAVMYQISLAPPDL